MVRVLTAIVLILSSALAAGTELNHQTSPAIAVKNSTVNNIYQVSPQLYRSGQPSKEQMPELKKLGIKSILNLRQYNSDTSEAENTGLILYRIRMNAGRIKDHQIVAALKIINEAPKPVLVHCWHGSDRTGTVVAMSRIIFEGWSKQAAIDELKQPQYGYHKNVYPNIEAYINNVDVESIRSQVFNKPAAQ